MTDINEILERLRDDANNGCEKPSDFMETAQELLNQLKGKKFAEVSEGGLWVARDDNAPQDTCLFYEQPSYDEKARVFYPVPDHSDNYVYIKNIPELAPGQSGRLVLVKEK